jgi:hypothetical protein
VNARPLALAAAVLAVAGVFFLLFHTGPELAGEEAARAAEAAALRARIAALEARLDAQARALAELEGPEARSASPRPAAPAPAPARGGGPEPRWFLEQYVRSFDGGGDGAELHRLGVEAFAPGLLPELLALIEDRSRPAGLRRKLAALVGTPRFEGHPQATLRLVGVLAPGDDATVVDAVLDALEEIGDRSTAEALAARAFDLDSGTPKALAVTTQLAGPAANRLLAGIFPRAPGDAARGAVVALLRTDDPAGALELYRQVPPAARPVRLLAAQRAGSFRSPEFRRFLEEWTAAETDPEVLAALGVARERQATVPNWDALQATGPPDAPDANLDSPKAWASVAPDGGAEWLELTYAPPLRASQARIHEVLAAGAVVELVGIDERGFRRTLWQGIDPLTGPGVFEVGFPLTEAPIQTLRIVLDTTKGAGWNEIDAVELVGPGGRAWASGARASSTYGAAEEARGAAVGTRRSLRGLERR